VEKINKLLIIGIDGAAFELITRWAEEGKLPWFQRVMDQGVSGILRSTIPPLSPPAWASFMTGKNPAKHSVFSFRVQDPCSYIVSRQLVNSGSIRAETMWQILSRHNKRVGVVNVPLTYPPIPIKGFVISGVLSPRSVQNSVYPPEMSHEVADLDSLWMDWRKKVETVGTCADVDMSSFVTAMDTIWQSTSSTMQRLYRKYFPKLDCLMIMIPLLDVVSHYMWKYIDPYCPGYSEEEASEYRGKVLRYFQGVDELVGSLYNKLDGSVCTMVVSDHGFGKEYAYQVCFNDWLETQGLLTLRGQKGVMPALKKVLCDLDLTKEGFRSLLYKLRIYRSFSSLVLDRISKDTRTALMRNLPHRTAEYYQIEWSKTKAYCLPYGPFSWQGVWINVEGGRPQGIVAPNGEYEQLRDLLVERLSELQDPETGVQLVECVLRREDVYSGPYLDYAPDLLVKLVEGYTGTSTVRNPALVVENPIKGRSGQHRRNGIWMLTGPGIKRGQRLDADIYDMAPTALHILGVPVPDDVDGKVVEGAFLEKQAVSFEKSRTVLPAIVAELSEKEDREIRERLKSLGYLD
jgi:predicted AlkP superfamily phosphohydrolase/phosphomutase